MSEELESARGQELESARGQELLSKVPTDGTLIGNITLRSALGWSRDDYWRIRNRLYEQGSLLLGGGKGGSVRLPPTPKQAEAGAPCSDTAAYANEADLYEPLKQQIESSWLSSEGFDKHNTIAQVTASQGRGPARGVWVRPDITVVAVTTYSIMPGRYLEVITFEVKMHGAVDVTAVYEALNHLRSATQSYVVFYVPTEVEQQLKSNLEEVCMEANRQGVGVITVSNPADFDTWDVLVDPRRHAAEPGRMDKFLVAQLSSENKNKLTRLLR